jgi:hypothetical protein
MNLIGVDLGRVCLPTEKTLKYEVEKTVISLLSSAVYGTFKMDGLTSHCILYGLVFAGLAFTK